MGEGARRSSGRNERYPVANKPHDDNHMAKGWTGCARSQPASPTPNRRGCLPRQ